MISGTYVLTDSIDQAFERIFNDIRAGSNAVISGKSEFDLSDGSGVTEPTFDESLLPEVQALPAVAAAEGSVDSDSTQLIGDDGKAVVYGRRAEPRILDREPRLALQSADPRRGLVAGPRIEVIVDKETASKEDFEVGEVIGVQAEGPVQRLQLSGVMQFSSGLTIGGATLAGFDLPTAQRSSRKRGSWTRSPSRRRRTTTGGAARDRSTRSSRPTRTSGPGSERRRGRCRGNERVHHLPAGLPPRLWRYRAVRRLLRHRELALDHDRPADA